jgi:hypothetical protein
MTGFNPMNVPDTFWRTIHRASGTISATRRLFLAQRWRGGRDPGATQWTYVLADNVSMLRPALAARSTLSSFFGDVPVSIFLVGSLVTCPC